MRGGRKAWQHQVGQGGTHRHLLGMFEPECLRLFQPVVVGLQEERKS